MRKVWVLAAALSLTLSAYGATAGPNAGFDIIERALNTPADALSNSANLRDQLAAGIDAAFGLNGVVVNTDTAEMFARAAGEHDMLAPYFEQAGVSAHEYVEMRQCLDVLSGHTPMVSGRYACGGQKTFVRLATVWEHAKAMPVEPAPQAASTPQRLNRVYIDAAWQGTMQCAQPDCRKSPIAFEIVHIGPNAYRIVWEDSSVTSGFYDPSARTLIATASNWDNRDTLTLQLSEDGASLTGDVKQPDGQIMEHLNLVRNAAK